jgi:hypothetical protein
MNEFISMELSLCALIASYFRLFSESELHSSRAFFGPTIDMTDGLRYLWTAKKRFG